MRSISDRSVRGMTITTLWTESAMPEAVTLDIRGEEHLDFGDDRPRLRAIWILTLATV